jgi:hypothetical protein
VKRRQSPYPLRLLHAVKAKVEHPAEAGGFSINQFTATAAAQNPAGTQTATFFAARRDKADFAGFDRIMLRKYDTPGAIEQGPWRER